MTTEVNYVPQVAQYVQEGNQLVEKAKALPVVTAEDAKAIDDLLVSVKQEQKNRVEWFKPHKARAKAVYDGLRDDERRALAPLEQVEAICEPKLKAWQDQEKTRREDEERKLREQAQALTDDDRLNKAAELEKQGRKEEADAILSDPTPGPSVLMPKPQVKFATSFPIYWHAEVVSLQLLAKSWLAGKVGKDSILPGMVYLNREATIRKEAMNVPNGRQAIPGVIAVSSRSGHTMTKGRKS